MDRTYRRLTAAALLALAAPALAEVTANAPDGFTVVHKSTANVPPAAMWRALLDWQGWWPAAHSYSGSAANLSLNPVAGGALREKWAGGEVLHATVLQARTERLLRLDGAFGPLQAMPVTAIMDLALAPDGTGTKISLTYRVSGPAIGQFAPAVDSVLSDAFTQLAAHRREQ